MTTVAINNAKQGLTRVPTYAELIKEIDKEKFKTKEIRDVFDRNAWYFHESPLGGVLRDGVSNMHPADLQQQNFKNMVNQATRAEEGTKFYDMDDEMGEMREEAIDDFEMAFDKEKAMREESSRRVAEQVKLSHSHDHYKANQGTYDSIKAKPSSSSSTQTQQPSSSSTQTQTQTQSFSAGIPPQSSGSYYSGSFIPHKPEEEQSFSAGIPPEEDETKSKHSVLKSALKHSKPIIKKVAQVVGQAKGGDIGGMVAEKLADYVIPDLDTDSKPKKGVKKSINKPEPKPFKPSEKKPKVSMDVDVQENPEMLNPKVKRPATSDRRTKVKIQKPDTTRPQAEKRPTDSTEGTTKTKTKRTKEPMPKKKTMKAITTDKKTLPAITVSGEPSRPSASSSSSSAPPPPKGKPQSYSPPKPEPAPAPKAEPKPAPPPKAEPKPPPPEPKAKPKPKAETKPKPKPKAEPAKPSSSTASSSRAKPPDKEVKKETTKKRPSHTVSTEPTDTISMQVMVTTLMAERDKKIDKADWNEFDQVYKVWKKTRRDDQVAKKAKLEEARKIYRKLYKKIAG